MLKGLGFPQLTAEHQDCPLFTVFFLKIYFYITSIVVHIVK